MLWTLFVILLVLWLIGVVSSYTLGGFIHLLLVLALVALISSCSPDDGLHSKTVRTRIDEEQQFNKEFPNRSEEAIVDKNRIKGKMDEIAGRAKRQAGEWTGDSQAQSEGAMGEIKGRAENTWGKVKDAARNVKDDMNRKDKERNAA